MTNTANSFKHFGVSELKAGHVYLTQPPFQSLFLVLKIEHRHDKNTTVWFLETDWKERRWSRVFNYRIDPRDPNFPAALMRVLPQ